MCVREREREGEGEAEGFVSCKRQGYHEAKKGENKAERKQQQSHMLCYAMLCIAGRQQWKRFITNLLSLLI